MSDVAAVNQLHQAHLASQVAMKVAVKAKDVTEQQGAAMVSLLEAAAELSQTLAAETGKGMHLDVTG